MQAGYAPAKAASHVNPALPRLPARVDTAREARRFSWSLLLVALTLGAAVEVFGPRWLQAIFQVLTLDNLGGVSALVTAVAVSIVLHEGGHLGAAILMDFEVLGICLGPVRTTRSHGKWTFEASGKLFTGSISAVPRNIRRWRERVLVVVAGGPLATLASGLLAGMILFHCPSEGWPKTFLAAVTELSGFLFVLGLVPNGRTAKVRNDARLFAMFWNETPDAQEILLYHLLTQLELAGVRPRDYPTGLIHAMAAIEGRPESMLVYAHTIALWALDRGDIASAKAWDERALELSESYNTAGQQAILARSACFDVLFREDLSAARKKLAAIEIDALAPAWLRHRTEAVHWLLEENIGEALAEIARAQYAFPKQLPYYEFERMLLTGLHRKALAVRPKELSTFRTSCAA